jgi:uncharacterized protein (DUF1684 family)
MKKCLGIVVLLVFARSSQGQSNVAWADSLSAYWSRIEAEFRDTAHTPLPKEARAGFHGLERFVPDSSYRVSSTFRAKQGKMFGMKTTTDRRPTYLPVGRLRFRLHGKRQQLTVYKNVALSEKPGFEHYLFVPFTDPTNGRTTYGGGRYLDLQGPLGRTVELDFNRAYNPYCAYGGRYSCPVPPAENGLIVPVEAGVKAFAH